MKGKIDYRKILMNSVCDYCAYHDICGLDEHYDCEAFRKLVKICEDLDLCNPDN